MFIYKNYILFLPLIKVSVVVKIKIPITNIETIVKNPPTTV